MRLISVFFSVCLLALIGGCGAGDTSVQVPDKPAPASAFHEKSGGIGKSTGTAAPAKPAQDGAAKK